MAQEVGLRQWSIDGTGGVSVLVGWTLGLGCFVYLLSLPPTLNAADESFLLYEAKRVLQGDALYRDFFDFLTPGSYYLYAIAYAVGGVSITSAKVTTALLHAVSVVCTYFLTLYVASVGEAILAGLLVVVICVPVLNIASHHWIATAFGLAAAAVFLAPRWQGSLRARPAAVGVLAGFVVCTHQGRGVWLITGLAAAISLLALGHGGRRRGRRWLGEVAWTAAGGAAICLAVLGYAVWHSSLAEMWYATYTHVTVSYRRHNVGRGVFFGAVPWAKVMFPGLAKFTYLWLLKSIPALLAVEIVAMLWAIWRQGLGSQLVRAALLLFALSAMGGIAYFAALGHVAFVTPFVLPVLAGMIHRARTGFGLVQNRWASVAARTVWVAALAMVLVKGWSNRQLAWWQNLVLFDTAFGTIAGAPMQRNTFAALHTKLQVDPSAPPRLFAYPSDAWIYLTLPADNPTPFCLLRFGYNTLEQFEIAKERLERDPQAFIFLVTPRKAAHDPFVHHVRARFFAMGKAGYGTLYGQYPRDRVAQAARRGGMGFEAAQWTRETLPRSRT